MNGNKLRHAYHILLDSPEGGNAPKTVFGEKKTKKETIYKRKFTVEYPDPTASGGLSRVQFDPSWDRVPSTGELVNTRKLAAQYIHELYHPVKRKSL